jgi:hypothetical protein
MLLLLAGLALADCPAPIRAAAVLSTTEAATTSYAAMDEEGFAEARARLDAEVACLGERLSPDQAAAVHRVHALSAFTARDELATYASFRAAHLAQPGYALTANLAPPNGPLARLYARAGQAPAPVPVPLPPLKATAWADGKPAEALPAEVPALVQLGDDAPAWSGVVASAAELPQSFLKLSSAPFTPTVASDPAQPAPLPSGPAPTPTRSPRAALLAGAASSALVAGGLYGGAAAMRVSYDADPRSETRKAVNGLYFSAVGVGLVGGALGVAGLVAPASGGVP